MLGGRYRRTMSNTIDLSQYGIHDCRKVIHNPSYEDLLVEEVHDNAKGYERGVMTEFDAVGVSTGQFTGRSPKDKYIVLDEMSRDSVWWDSTQFPNDNKPMTEPVWQSLKELVTDELSNKRLFVVDTFCGANPHSRLKVRFIVEVAWQAHFVKNMFIRPTEEQLQSFGEPDFVVLNGAKTSAKDWQALGLHSEVFVAFNLSEKLQIIGGTWYGGEMKKGMFSMMNYYLPRQHIASMHCAANVGEAGDVALLFGLSGTGKTTLSADPKRKLIGDDEHGWDDEGIFNFEGGCYAKTIDLDKSKEPDIYNAIRRNALLENITIDKQGKVDFSDKSVTENTRVSYPIDHIERIVKPESKAGHASKIIFLTADAFGVLPAVSYLTHDQIRYYFLSGFTAKVAGTERGISEPMPTFSACFGQAFLSLHPIKYADELMAKIDKAGSRVYLVNTGWNGSGERFSIKDTRAIIDAIMSGAIERSNIVTIPIFNLKIPKNIDGIDSKLLDPRLSYKKSIEWTLKASKLAEKFVANFEKYSDSEDYIRLVSAGPNLGYGISARYA